ncbi:MAG: hypothetical protein INR68_06330 [Methylobacterium mesophilicum]|nr:hypothetical protein [Methylobacterium mesophilicum]
MRPFIRGLALSATLALGASPPVAARAQENAPRFDGERGLRALLLPYAPAAFDLGLLVARSFAEITYDGRRYDPVTEAFVVDNLRIRRDQFGMSVERLRADERVTQFQGLVVDTRNLALPPPLRAGLDRLGLQTVKGDVTVDYRTDNARAAYAVAVQMDFPKLGSLEAEGVLDGFHVLLPLGEPGEAAIDSLETLPESGVPSRPAKILGTLRASSVTYRDAGLLDAVIGVSAQAQGVSPDEMRAGFGAMVGMGLAPTVDGLPGGDDPALRARAQDWSRAVQRFLDSKNSIRITLDPSKPVPLERFQAGMIDKKTVAELNPAIVSPAPARLAAVALDGSGDPLLAARAQLSGQGAIQDEAAGIRALLKLADGGNLDAVRALGDGFGVRPLPALAAEEQGALLRFLLVGRALGTDVSDAALSQVDASLSPEARQKAEQEAWSFFRRRTAQGKAAIELTTDTVSTFSPSQLRGLAFDAYEGRNSTRDMTEAYAIALVASAAGDGPAVSLRDDLARAAQAGRIAIVMDHARKRADALWDAYRAQNGAQPPK